MPDAAGYTVIIPTRDRRDMVARAIASVAAQTLAPDKVIVVDNSTSAEAIDCSTLSARGIAFNVLHAPQATNAAAVRNHGLQQTNARFIAFLDDDDTWLPEKMQTQLAYLRAHPACSAVVCGRLVVSERAKFAECPTESQIAALLPYDNFGGSFSFIVYDRERCGGLLLDERLGAFQDWDFLLRAARHGDIGMVPEVMAVYHDHAAPRITRTIVGRQRALKYLHVTHRELLHRDARRWMISRGWDLRAQEQAGRKEWRAACRSVGRSLRWGWRCRLPWLLKYRSLGRRSMLLLPPGITSVARSMVVKVKGLGRTGRRPGLSK